MLIPADATSTTISLLIVFGGIGVLVNLLVVYAVAQVLAERRDNEDRQEGTGS